MIKEKKTPDLFWSSSAPTRRQTETLEAAFKMMAEGTSPVSLAAFEGDCLGKFE